MNTEAGQLTPVVSTLDASMRNMMISLFTRGTTDYNCEVRIKHTIGLVTRAVTINETETMNMSYSALKIIQCRKTLLKELKKLCLVHNW